MLEASSVAAGSSGKGGGFIASWATPECIAPLSFDLHRKLAAEHDGAKAWGFRTVYAAEVKLEAAHTSSSSSSASRDNHSSPDQWPSNLDWLIPDSVRDYNEMGTPANSGQVHPFLFTTRLAELAERKGVEIIPGRATAINYRDDMSRVVSVSYTTSQGEQTTIGATDVLVAAGPWSSRLLSQVKLQTPKGHSIVIKPSRDTISPYILFAEISNIPSGTSLSPDIYPRPPDALNGFETIYASGPDCYDTPLPELASDTIVETDRRDDVWRAVSSVSREIRDGEVMTVQACYKAQIRKHGDEDETGPMVGPLDVGGLWLATGLDEWGVQNGPGVGLVMSEMLLEGRASSADVGPLDPKLWM